MQCGSALFSCEPGTQDYTGVRLGAIDGDPGVRPESRQFVAYAACWEELPDDGLPRFPEPITNGMAADLVLGQPNFTTRSCVVDAETLC